MGVTQITTFEADGKPIQTQQNLSCSEEKNEPMHLESGVINLYPGITYQTIDGFGGAMTESSAYLLMSLGKEERREVLKALFGPQGNRLKFIRTSIDSCDFGLGEYQAVEDPLKDPDFATFTLDRDRKYIIPMIREAMEVSAEPLSVLLSPWSPPKQWKTPPARPKNDASVYGGMFGDINYDEPSRDFGGSLKPEYYGAWARYLAKYVRAYLDEGIPVTMMTMQNESIAATPWDSCVWEAAEQKKFLRDDLWPEFVKAGLSDQVKLYIWDHNKERVLEWSLAMLDEETIPMVGGIAFHWYSGDHFEDVQMTREKFPDMNLMLSECCCMGREEADERIAMFGQRPDKTPAQKDYLDAVSYAHELIGDLNAGTNRWIDWNFCLDAKGGPRHVPGGCSSSVIIEQGKVSYSMIFPYIGHFSKYILPGARRIGLSRCDDKVEASAAVNPDGTIAVVLLNRGAEDAFYAFRVQGHVIRFAVPRRTISTILIPKEAYQD